MLKVLLLGSRSDFSAIVLEGLISAGVPVCAVALHRASGPAPRSTEIPVLRGGDLAALAGARRIPLMALDVRSDEAARERAARYRPDLLVIACFPRILRERWLGLAPHGAFNLHPSRLPAYRGPSPLFWQFRNGERRMGISVHRAIAAADAGPVVAAECIAVAPGARAGEINAALARRGGALLVRTLERIRAGTLCECAQDESRATCFGWPDAAAFRIPTSWPAERAFRFMRGTGEWGRAFTIEVGTGTGTVSAEGALGFEARGGAEGQVQREGRTATIGFAAGTLRVRCAAAPGGRRRD